MAEAPTTAGSILVVDDEPEMLKVLSRVLMRGGYRVDTSSSGKQALEKLALEPFDAVLMDVHMPGESGIETLAEMRERGHLQPVVIMSGEGTLEMAVKAVRQGAFDFLDKPLRPDRVRLTIENALRFARLATAHEALSEEAEVGHQLLGSTPAMEDLRALIAKAAPSEGRVLITGENGTGKELVARAIHDGSPRAERPFIKLNCAAVPSELIESELFGHEKGAFTGAVAAKPGKFEQAHHGTLFLDEVGDMPALMQAKLLRVLEGGEIERVGATQSKLVDVRVVAATNRDLDAMVEAGEFREDLYYRLNVVALHVPALRQRRDDIPELARNFVQLAASRNTKRLFRIDEAAERRLTAHDFPGNVRELKNLIERLVIFADGDVITEREVERAFAGRDAQRHAEALYREGEPLKELVAEAERSILKQALRAHDGNMTETANALGVERSHLYKKLKALGIERPPR
jgi:DNA-binding NtrC family response regulator